MGSNLRIGKDPNTGFWYLSAADAATLGISAYIQTLLNDADAAAAQATLGLTSVVAGVVDAPRAVGANCANNAVTPTTQFDLNADWLMLVSPSSFLPVVRKAPGAITCNVSTAGPAANGRDQGAVFSANSWIHFYWIWNGATLATIASATAPPTGPSLPSGYTHWAYAGAVRFNGSSQLLTTYIRGNVCYYALPQTALAGGTATAETAVSLAALIPPNAMDSIMVIDAFMTTTAGQALQGIASFRVRSGSDFYNYMLGPAADLGGSSAQRLGAPIELRAPNVAQNCYYVCANTTGTSCTMSIYVNGYSVPNG